MTDEIVKICKVHGGLTKDKIYKNKNGDKFSLKCKYCVKETGHQYQKNNREKCNKRKKEWNYKNRERLLKRIKLYRQKNIIKLRLQEKKRLEKNPERVKNNQKKYMSKPESQEKRRVADRIRIKNLANGYVKKNLIARTNLLAKDIPQELVELKKSQLLLKRELKKLKNPKGE